MALEISKILVPTDFSNCARAAFTQGLALARQHRAELHLLHVMMSHDEDPYSLVYQVSDQSTILQQQEELCRSTMEVLIDKHDTEGLEVHRHLRRAFAAAPAILDFVAEQGVDLLVIGGHGRRGLRRFLLGSVAEEVVRLAPCPVLTVREASQPLDFSSLGRIVVPVDFSAHSRLAFELARDLATAGSRLELVHVVELPVYPHYYDILHDQSQEFAFPQIAVKVEEALARFVAEAGGPEVECRAKVLEGPPAASLAEYVSSSGADLLVIATHGLTGLRHLLLGSVTEKLVRSVTCPVLTLKGTGPSAVGGTAAGDADPEPTGSGPEEGSDSGGAER